MLELVTDGDTRSIVAGGLRLAFRWTGDRWEHALERRQPGEARPLVVARTIEGDPDRDDPARVVSPTYQQLEFQGDGATRQALLVGQSGPHHFSAVFAVEEVPRDDRPGASRVIIIRVDVADRCRTPVEALACTYLVDAVSDDLVDAGPSLIAWDLGPDRLTFAATEPARVALAEGGRRATQVQALAGPAPGSSTRRCLYSWRWSPDSRRAT